MNIVVLLQAVPVGGTEPLDEPRRVDRSASLEPNGNDEYCLEKALQLTEAHGGEVTVLSIGPAGALAPIRQALAMGAARGAPRRRGRRCGGDRLDGSAPARAAVPLQRGRHRAGRR